MVGGGLDYSAAFQRAIELIGKRWTGAVVKALIPAPARFNQLLSGILGISDRVLTERLRSSRQKESWRGSSTRDRREG